MDILHLSDGELDFELQLRNEDQQRRTKREKTSRLREHIEKERVNMEMPLGADHVISQEDHLQHCQAKLQFINDRVRKGLEKEDALELAVCRSKLLHYRSRLQMITEKNLAGYVKQLEDAVELSLRKINDFFADTTILDIPPPNTVPEANDAILPDDAEVLERLKNAQLQSSVKSRNERQPASQHISAEQHLDQMRQLQEQQLLLQKQIELQRMQQEQLQRELQIQQQLYQLRLQKDQSQQQATDPAPANPRGWRPEGELAGQQNNAPIATSGAIQQNQNNPSMRTTNNTYIQQPDLQGRMTPDFPDRLEDHYGQGMPNTTNQQYGTTTN